MKNRLTVECQSFFVLVKMQESYYNRVNIINWRCVKMDNNQRRDNGMVYISDNATISVKGLNEKQVTVVYNIIECFREENEKSADS